MLLLPQDTAAREAVEKRDRERADMAAAIRQPMPLRKLFDRAIDKPVSADVVQKLQQRSTSRFYVPISKRNDEARMVYGYASTEALDSQGERISLAALEQALPEYMRFANVREMHQQSAVGVTKEADVDDKGLYIGVKVVDAAAWTKVKEGVYQGFSIGGKSVAKSRDTITELKLTEISLVDRPSNPEALFDLWKADVSTIRKQDPSANTGLGALLIAAMMPSIC